MAQDPVDVKTQLKAQIAQHYQMSTPLQATHVVGSQELSNLFQVALEEAGQLGDEYISTCTLLLAMFDHRTGHIADFLRQARLKRSQVLEELKQLRQGRTITDADAESEADVLAKYTRDLTELARQGGLDPVIGRKEEIGLVIQTLSRRKKNNPVQEIDKHPL